MRDEERPTTSTAPLHLPEPSPYVVEEDEGPALPRLRIFGMSLTSFVLLVMVTGGALFALGRFIAFSRAEVARSAEELHEGGFGRR